MIEIKPLERFDLDTFRRMSPGYVSTEKYAVSKTESLDKTVITLERVTLDQPYHKLWEADEFDIDVYPRIAQHGHSFGAYDGDKWVGLALCEIHEWNKTLWIWELGVDAAYRRQGIARWLVERLAQFCRENGLRVMVAETQNTNMPAIRFYRAAGFEIDALDLSYYTNDDVTDFEVALFMKRKV